MQRRCWWWWYWWQWWWWWPGCRGCKGCRCRGGPSWQRGCKSRTGGLVRRKCACKYRLFFLLTPLFSTKIKIRSTRQPDALLDEGYHERAVLVGSMAFSNLGTEHGRGWGKWENRPVWVYSSWLFMCFCNDIHQDKSCMPGYIFTMIDTHLLSRL